MKASLNLDQWADPSSMPPENASLLKWKFVRGASGIPERIPYFPKGAVFEGPQALRMCRTGQATPADDECMEALGLSAEESKSLAVEYEMNTLGVWDKKDRELFKAGVIAGYNEDGTAKPGPNWDSYQEALAESEIKGDI